jgi:mRNA interferase MazF
MIYRQWDIIEFDFSPAKGHEPKGRRPALVVSRDVFNSGTSMALVCPITTADNGFPLHFKLPDGLTTQGFVAVEQIRAFDLDARATVLVENLDNQELQRSIVECIHSFV